MQWDCRLSTGLPPSSRLCQLWSLKEDLQQAWNRDRRAVWDQVGLSHCRHHGLVTVRDKARLRQGHNDQTWRGHQCSKTSLTGETLFHYEFVHSRYANRWPLCGKKMVDLLDHWDCVLELKLQGLHRAPPQQLDWGSNRSLCCKEEEDLQGVEWNRGWQYVITAGFSHCRREA